MMARYALPRVLSRPSTVSGGGPSFVGGPILPRFAQQLSEVRRQGIAAASCPLPPPARETISGVVVVQSFLHLRPLGFYQRWLSSVRGGTTVGRGENWQDARDPNLFPSFRSRPC